MNTINFDEHNQIDDLRIQRAISGLDESQMRQLMELHRERQWEDEFEEVDDFNEFDRCLGVLDTWLASDSWACLASDQKSQLMSAFSEMKTDAVKPAARVDGCEAWPADSRSRSASRRNWMLAALVPIAAALVVLASLPFGVDRATGYSGMLKNSTSLSAFDLRNQMLGNPPVDMLRWVWAPSADVPHHFFW